MLHTSSDEINFVCVCVLSSCDSNADNDISTKQDNFYRGAIVPCHLRFVINIIGLKSLKAALGFPKAAACRYLGFVFSMACGSGGCQQQLQPVDPVPDQPFTDPPWSVRPSPIQVEKKRF